LKYATSRGMSNSERCEGSAVAEVCSSMGFWILT
jgi:hypothetical protein